ncbi:MAG: GNAT family N-acetyltransferase [Chthoniobacterales bacterium]|nr:GNAT family N-acetyltransferase [Chthoniobacterales bacterium]
MITQLTASEDSISQSEPSHLLAGADVTLSLLDPLSGREWDQLIARHAGACFFHSSAWARVLVESYGHHPIYLRLVTQNGEALLPLMEVRSRFTGRRGVCLPFSDFCGPLLSGGITETQILSVVAKVAREREWKYFQIRSAITNGAVIPPSDTYWSHEIKLHRDLEQTRHRFFSATRRAIRKASSQGLETVISYDWKGVSTFCRLHAITRRRHGVPPQPLRFFRKIFESVIAPGRGFVVLHKTAKRAAAGAIFFQFGRSAIYKYAASDSGWQHLRGNNATLWAAIQHLSEKGCDSLHLGRTSLTNEGLRRFKLGWGATENMIFYSTWDCRANTWRIARDRGLANYQPIFSKLPLSLNRLAGSVLYPHLD